MEKKNQEFVHFRTLSCHELPLTNCAFNKSGDKYIIKLYRFITGSYDQTCKVWDTVSGENLQSLKGHKNVVYAISFNLPFGYLLFNW